MPRESQRRVKPRDFTAAGTDPGFRVNPDTTHPSDSAMLAASAHAEPGGATGSHMTRPTLPPLSYLQAGSPYPTSLASASSTSYSGGGSHVIPSQHTSPLAPPTFSTLGRGDVDPSPLPFRGSERDYHAPNPGAEHGRLPPTGPPSSIPLKRPYEPSESGFYRFVRPGSDVHRC